MVFLDKINLMTNLIQTLKSTLSLNEKYIHPDVRVKFSWKERISLIVFWPYTIYVFAKVILGFENGEEIEEEDKL